jgi:hypothetical protein
VWSLFLWRRLTPKANRSLKYSCQCPCGELREGLREIASQQVNIQPKGQALSRFQARKVSFEEEEEALVH